MGALEGIKVLEMGLLVQGPQAAALLAQMGAEVIKVELPGFGDQAGWLPIVLPTTCAARSSSGATAASAASRSTCAGPRGARCSCAWPTGGRRDHELQAGDDGRLGPRVRGAVGPEPGHRLRRRVGVRPDRARRRPEGADLSAQAAGGLISATGADGGDPTTIGITICDHISSLNLVNGVLAALLARGRTGRGQRVDVSLLGSQIWAQASEYTYYLASGELPGRPNRGHPLIAALYGIMPTADGWLAIVGVVGPQRQVFYDAIGRPDLVDDPRFASLLLTKEQKAGLFAELAEVFVQRPTAEWCEILHAAGQRFAPVRSYDQVADDPHVWENGYLARGRR